MSGYAKLLLALSFVLVSVTVAWAEDVVTEEVNAEVLEAEEVKAEEVKTVKVYRDYPGYVESPVCENPRFADEGSGTDSDEASGHFYLGAWLGLNVLSSADLSFEFSRDLDAEYDHGYAGGAVLGYDYGALRFDFEGSYRNNSFDTVKRGDDSLSGVDGDFELATALLNLYYDFESGSPTTPYIGVGLGWAEVSLDTLEAGQVLLVDDEDEVAAAQLAAGCQFALSPAMSLDVGYRFLATEDPEMTSTVGEKIETEVRSHLVLVGLTYTF